MIAFFKKNYLFIYFWLRWVFVSVRGLSLVATSRGHSSSRCTGLSLSRLLLLWSTGSRRAGSVVVAHGPSCSVACGIFPDQGLEPVSPALAGRFSTTAPPGKPMMIAFKLGVGEQAENIPPQKRQFMILVISAIKNLKQGEGAREYWGRGRGYYFTYEGLSGRVLKEVKKRAWKYLEEEHSRQQK